MDCADTKAWLARYEREEPPSETREAIAKHAARCPSCAGDPRLVALMPRESLPPEAARANGRSGSFLSDAVYLFATKAICVLAAIALAYSAYAGARVAWRLSNPQLAPDDIREIMAQPFAAAVEKPEPVETETLDSTPLERLSALAREATQVTFSDLGSLAGISSRFRRQENVKTIRNLGSSSVLTASRAIAVEACLLRLGGAGWDADEWRKTLALMEMHEVLKALDKAVAAEREGRSE